MSASVRTINVGSWRGGGNEKKNEADEEEGQKKGREKDEDESSEESKIILPPKDPPHNVDSRKQYYNYFINNRIFVNYEEELNIKDYDFIIVTKGYFDSYYDNDPVKNYLWPDFEIDSEKFIYIYKDASNELKRDVWYGKYNPSHFMDEDIWGLIEVRKD